MSTTFVRLATCLLLTGGAQGQGSQLGLRADWLRGSWGALWLPERTYNGNIEGVTIDAFLTQIEELKTIDYVQVPLTSPNIFSPAHTGPHPILQSLWQGDTDANGDPINLIVPRTSAQDPLLSWLEALNAAGLKSEIYVNSYNLLARIPANIPSDYPDLSARWENFCDTNPTVQAFISNHPHLAPEDPERRKYMFCYAEFILKEYSLRYGDLIDAWTFDSADNIMEDCGDDAASGVLDDQRIYEAFANACHAGNPNAAISFNNSVGNDIAPFATPSLFDDYTFGHPFGGAGNMVVPEILYTRNFAICEYMQEHNGLPFVTTDDRLWNDNVVAHFFPKQSTTSWNAGSAPCLTDAQFVEWTAEGVLNGGAITWGTPLFRTNLENSPILTLREYALNQLELVDEHFSELQFPDVPNWRRAETPFPKANGQTPYTHTLTDGVDFWDPAGGSITSLTAIGQPSWLTVAETSPSSGEWTLSGTPTETITSEHSFDLKIMMGTVESTRTVQLVVEVPVPPPVGLVAYWRLDEEFGLTVTDFSGNEFHGSPVNTSSTTGVSDGALNFNGSNSRILIPEATFASISDQITLTMWIKGDSTQPSNDAIFQARDTNGDRAINIHLPWSNSTVFWDAGTGGQPYDRISKTALPSNFKERWNHWSFTKNSTSGDMNIYLNGSPWHSGSGKFKSMSGVTEGTLGSGVSSARYGGMVDEVMLFNTALNDSEVKELYEGYQGFESWLTRHPSLEQVELLFDANSDGTPLLLEYIFDGNPFVSDPLILPSAESSDENFIFKYTRRSESANDTEQIFQHSANLIDWTDILITGQQAAEVSIDEEVNDTEEVTITISQDVEIGGRLFGRLKATR
ncbi:MAG: LamG domain-containing protein [Roseibacillus sp.]